MYRSAYKLLLFALLAIAGSCKSIAYSPIDAEPNIIIDTNLCGIWKAVEDTNKADYVLIQNFYEAHEKILGYMTKDAMKYRNYEYYMTRMNNNGTNPYYQEWRSYLSTIGSIRFLNVTYWNELDNGKRENGYFFTRIIRFNNTHDTVVTAIVADTTMKRFTTSAQVRSYIEKNAAKPFFYSDTLHFYKVSSYHASLNGSVGIANPKRKH